MGYKPTGRPSGRPKRKVVEYDVKDYVQRPGTPVLPVEDFYPGCVCASGQLLPHEISITKVRDAAKLGMRNTQIASLMGCREDTLMTHFRKTIAQERAHAAMKLLGMVNTRAEDMEAGKKHDFASLQYLLDRQDPAPPPAPLVIALQPLPKDIIEMEATVMTDELKQLRFNKESN